MASGTTARPSLCSNLFLNRCIFPPSRTVRTRLTLPQMSGGEGRNGEKYLRESNHEVRRLQQLVSGDSTGGWDKAWQQGLTPWNLRQPTPIIVHLNQIGALPKGRALVPGCGRGYDVVAMACPERYVVGLDISGKAISKAIELSSTSQCKNYFTFLKADFFNWHSAESFDLIFDYLFFSAIEPEMRPAWARKMDELLKPEGDLITLIFPISDHVGGPPYGASVADYEDVLEPLGFKAISVKDNEFAVGPRKGREQCATWKRSRPLSSL